MWVFQRPKEFNHMCKVCETKPMVYLSSFLNLRKRMGKERRRQTLSDKRDNNYV